MTVDDFSSECSYHFTYDDSPSEVTLTAAAWLTDRDQTDLKPLYAIIDPDALDELLESADGRDLRVEFTYEGCAITIGSSGDMYVRPTPDLNRGRRGTTSAVLLLDESPDSTAESPASFHAPPVSFEDADTLVVTFSAEMAETWRDVMDGNSVDRPNIDRILLAGEFTRSSDIHSAEAMAQWNDIQLDTVPDPTNLTAIGLLIAHFLEECESKENRTVVCFQSTSELLLHVSLQEAFQFLTLVLSRLRIGEATGYFYLDPTAHDEQTRLTLESLFETVASRTTDGQWVVRAD